MEKLQDRILLSLLDEGARIGHDQFWEQAEEDAYAYGYKQGMATALERGYADAAAETFAEGYAASQVEHTIHDFFEKYRPWVNVAADAYMEDRYEEYIAGCYEETEGE